jgi:hypothetical protein
LTFNDPIRLLADSNAIIETVQQHAVAKAAISPGPGFNTMGA